jgi:hypothetical protein
LFILGRQPAPTPAEGRKKPGVPRWQRWEWQDLIRILIPPAAFAGWVILQSASVWNAVVPSMSSGMRILVPTVGAVLLAAITKALAAHSDQKPSPGQATAARPPQRPVVGELEPAPSPAPSPASSSPEAENKPSVPNWIY